MPSSRALLLASNVSVVANQTAGSWTGGRSAIIISATTYPTTCFLQYQNSDGTWVNVNSTTYSANQVTAYDTPAGQYRLSMSGGTVAALTANLVSVPYG